MSLIELFQLMAKKIADDSNKSKSQIKKRKPPQVKILTHDHQS